MVDNADKGNPFSAILLPRRLEKRQFVLTGRAPGGPEVDHDDLTAKVREGQRGAVKQIEGKIRSGLAGEGPPHRLGHCPVAGPPHRHTGDNQHQQSCHQANGSPYRPAPRIGRRKTGSTDCWPQSYCPAGQEDQAAQPEEAGQRVDEHLEGRRRPVLSPPGQYQVEVLSQPRSQCGYRHRLAAIRVLVHLGLERGQIDAVPVGGERGSRHQVILGGLLSQFLVYQSVCPHVDRLARREHELRLERVHTGPDDAKCHQNHASVDQVTAVPAAVAANKRPEGLKGALFRASAAAGDTPDVFSQNRCPGQTDDGESNQGERPVEARQRGNAGHQGRPQQGQQPIAPQAPQGGSRSPK